MEISLITHNRRKFKYCHRIVSSVLCVCLCGFFFWTGKYIDSSFTYSTALAKILQCFQLFLVFLADGSCCFFGRQLLHHVVLKHICIFVTEDAVRAEVFVAVSAVMCGFHVLRYCLANVTQLRETNTKVQIEKLFSLRLFCDVTSSVT